MDGVKNLDSSPHELLGIEGAERLETDDGNWGSPPRPNRHHVPGTTPPYNRRPPGRESSAGRVTEGVVVLLEPGPNRPPGDGKDPYFIEALRRKGPVSAVG